jgi:hypothetical protein
MGDVVGCGEKVHLAGGIPYSTGAFRDSVRIYAAILKSQEEWPIQDSAATAIGG